MRLQLDSLVRGKAGFTEKVVQGRVYGIRAGAVALIDDDGKQWIVYEPEVLDKPRLLSDRTEPPARLR